MRKRVSLLLLLGFLLVILTSLSFVSAALCRGNDGYYHDCDDFSYKKGYKVYEGEIYYDREKYSTYYEYRNRFSPHHYVYYYKSDQLYGDDKRNYNRDEGDAYIVYKKNRMSWEERKEFEERWDDKDLKKNKDWWVEKKAKDLNKKKDWRNIQKKI